MFSKDVKFTKCWFQGFIHKNVVFHIFQNVGFKFFMFFKGFQKCFSLFFKGFQNVSFRLFMFFDFSCFSSFYKMCVSSFFSSFSGFHIFHVFPKCWFQELISKGVKFTKCWFQVFHGFPKCWLQVLISKDVNFTNVGFKGLFIKMLSSQNVSYFKNFPFLSVPTTIHIIFQGFPKYWFQVFLVFHIFHDFMVFQNVDFKCWFRKM